MSILLDSLRKSEAQRKIKDAPTIHSAAAYGSRAPRQRGWPGIAMVGLTAAAIAWFGWQQFADPGAPASVASEDQVMPVEDDRVANADTSRESAPDDGSVRTPVERLTQDGQSPAAEAPAAPSPADRIAAFAAEESEPADQGNEVYAETRTDDAGEFSAGVESPVDGTSADAGTDRFPGLEAPARDGAGQVESGEPGPRSYWSLPQSWRSEMPEFRITVLVYAEAPEDRFLLINGERLREGDPLEGGVVLEEIRRDGAVFSYRQTRFLVKS